MNMVSGRGTWMGFLRRDGGRGGRCSLHCEVCTGWCRQGGVKRVNQTRRAVALADHLREHLLDFEPLYLKARLFEKQAWCLGNNRQIN